MENEIINNLKITDTAYGGAGVGRSDAGQVIFVQKTVEGDIADVEIMQDKKTFANARLLKIIKPSEKRIKADCKYSEYCGGCSFAHIGYDYQLEIKKRIVLNSLRKYSHSLPEISIMKSEKTGYRLRATARSKNGRIGFFEHNTNNLIYAENCLVIKGSLYEKMRSFAMDTRLTGEIYGIENDDGISLADIKAEHIDFTGLKYFDGVTINNKKYGLSQMSFNTPYGAVPVTYKSFFQANRYLLNDFQEKAVSLVSNGMDIVELYAGAGFFTCGLMRQGHVEACESDIVSANLGRNTGYDIKNQSAEIFMQKVKKCDTIFMDPPRDGISKKVYEQIERLKPYEIIYVSCNPVTLARDIIRLEKDYKVTDFTIFDMYPDTYHVESVVKLKRV